ncbi:hypothetical protein [Virgibacillus sp. DJP39]|uniref:hypothetical protein n=1 Tax=Virgibacillus sp. DJP39 TaxID=3409790 RepID=UPI003BB55AF9
MLRNIITKEMMTPEETTDDFQDLELWKKLTVEVENQLIQYKMNLIVPITIHNKRNFQYILDGFKILDDQTYHFCLTAKQETIHDRLFKRGEQEGNWCFEQTSKCIEAFTDKAFEEFITTDNLA